MLGVEQRNPTQLADSDRPTDDPPDSGPIQIDHVHGGMGIGPRPEEQIPGGEIAMPDPDPVKRTNERTDAPDRSLDVEVGEAGVRSSAAERVDQSAELDCPFEMASHEETRPTVGFTVRRKDQDRFRRRDPGLGEGHGGVPRPLGPGVAAPPAIESRAEGARGKLLDRDVEGALVDIEPDAARGARAALDAMGPSRRVEDLGSGSGHGFVGQ